MTLLKKKPIQLVIVLLLAVGIVLVGTFAWSSFNQSKINVFTELIAPDVNLHDDFEGGPNKDVYVENSGQSNIFLRVRLTEFLQTTVWGSLVEGHVRDDDKAHNWAPHNATLKTVKGTIDSCTLIDPNKNSAAWGSDNFHDYYTWLMGGNTENTAAQIYYLPATTEQKGEYLPDGTVVREPQVVGNPLTGTSTVGDASIDYKEAVNAAIAADTGVAGGTGDTDYPDIAPDDPDVDKLLAEAKKARAMETLGVKETLPGDPIITMTQWVMGNKTDSPNDPDHRAKYAKGDFWVIDEEDGWCYWANPLPGGQATSLLLDKVNRTKKTFDSNAEYAINAMLQATDENDLGKFEMADAGGITNDGRKLLQLAAGKIVIGSDGAEFKNNGDGTYTPTFDKDGNAITDGKAFIPLGEDKVDVTTKLEIGTRVVIATDLAWDGFEYTNHAELNTAENNKLYNLTVSTVDNAETDSGKQVYAVAGTYKGADGKVYLKLSPAGTDGTIDTSTVSYLASVKETTVDTVKTYTNDYPGTAPYGMLWAGADGVIGNGDDSRFDPTADFNSRFFHHIGNGVYLETADKGGTASKDDPVKYFFAGQYVTAGVISGANGTADEKVNSIFTLQLAVGDKFNVTFTPDDGDNATPILVESYAAAADGAYTMQALEQGVDKNHYISLGNAKAGYIGVGADSFIGNIGAGKADARRWAGPMGIGTPQDPIIAPSDFTEPFLKGKSIEDLAVGKSFNVDGMDWVVANIDGYGNRLIVSKQIFSTGTNMVNGIYSQSATETSFNKFYAEGIPVLKSYVQPTNDLSGNRLTTVGNSAASAFPLSEADYNAYKQMLTAADGAGLSWTHHMRLRSPGTAANQARLVNSSTKQPEDIGGNSTVAQYAALIVRFSDAKNYINPNSTFLPIGFKNVKGESFMADGRAWVVLDKDAAGNSFITSDVPVQNTTVFNPNGAGNLYTGSTAQANYRKYTGQTIPTLKPMVQKAAIPYNSAYYIETMGNTVNTQFLSSVSSTGEATAFPLSVAEVNKYLKPMGMFAKSNLPSYLLRDRGRSTAEHLVIYSNSTLGPNYYYMAATMRPAMWVNLSSQMP